MWGHVCTVDRCLAIEQFRDRQIEAVLGLVLFARAPLIIAAVFLTVNSCLAGLCKPCKWLLLVGSIAKLLLE
jgi:hypothetical protein